MRTPDSPPLRTRAGFSCRRPQYSGPTQTARTVPATAINPGLSRLTHARKPQHVQRVPRGNRKPRQFVAYNRRRRKGEILCHNRVLDTAATADEVHGFRWFTVCAPAGWNPASEEWEVCPCGWRTELRKHYAKASHVQWWREQIKERGSLEAVYREVRRRQREYRNTDVG